MNPVEAADDYMKAFKQLMDLEQLAILAAQARDRRTDPVSLLEHVKRRFARALEPVRLAVDAAGDPDERRILAWRALRGRGMAGGHVPGSAGGDLAGERGELLRWHESVTRSGRPSRPAAATSR